MMTFMPRRPTLFTTTVAPGKLEVVFTWPRQGRAVGKKGHSVKRISEESVLRGRIEPGDVIVVGVNGSPYVWLSRLYDE